MKIYGIIPARYASTRFPGKPLALILDKPMFCHVYENSRECLLLDGLYLATDDERILETAKKYDVPVIMTKSTHTSGSDRVLEAAELIGAEDEDIIINIQGDEPLVRKEMIIDLIQPFFDDSFVEVTTLSCPITYDEARDPNLVKVVFNSDFWALYFSRAPIPYQRDPQDLGFMYWGHIGLYGFKFSILKRFSALKKGKLEEIEKLEQLRLLEFGIPIKVSTTHYKTIGVDKPEDIPKVEDILSKQRLLEGKKDD